MDKLIITPKTKIYDLLEAFPELENTLISSASQFKKLQNPVLRKTITKITNLNQAAVIGGLNVEELVNKLRKAAGQENISSLDDTGTVFNTEKPEWFKDELIANTIDIRDMLHEGEQPVHEVLSAIKKLDKNQILKTIAPFVPAPLIDKSLSLDYKHWLDKKSEEEVFVYFKKD
jgi:Domain of unknown function (DUF1858)